MITLLLSLPDEPAGPSLAGPRRQIPSTLPGGPPAPDRVGIALLGAGGVALWLAAVLLVSGIIARLQLGYWPDATFCGLAFGAGASDCMSGQGAIPSLAGFLLDEVDAAFVIGVAGALLVLTGLKRGI